MLVLSMYIRALQHARTPTGGEEGGRRGEGYKSRRAETEDGLIGQGGAGAGEADT